MPVSFLLIALPKIKAIPTTGVNNAFHRFQQNPGRSEEVIQIKITLSLRLSYREKTTRKDKNKKIKGIYSSFVHACIVVGSMNFASACTIGRFNSMAIGK